MLITKIKKISCQIKKLIALGAVASTLVKERVLGCVPHLPDFPRAATVCSYVSLRDQDFYRWAYKVFKLQLT